MLSSSIPSWLQTHTSSAFIKVADHICRNAGLRVTLMKNSLDSKRAELLSKLGVRVVFDVGANSGQYAQLIRELGYKQRIISFEPVPVAYEALTTKSLQIAPHIACQMALDSTDGRKTINITKNSTCSSLLQPANWLAEANPGAQPIQTVEVQTRRLDSVANAYLQPDDIGWLKLDTQGSEADIIRGAEHTLDRIVGVEIELSTIPLYRDQPLLPEVWSLLTGVGFEPYWIERGYRDPRTDRITQIDGLFIRKGSFQN